ncbi:hypothetical protein SMM50_005209 [Salmonella enterica]|nr:hypothetical protein [Salmonella enterica]
MYNPCNEITPLIEVYQRWLNDQTRLAVRYGISTRKTHQWHTLTTTGITLADGRQLTMVVPACLLSVSPEVRGTWDHNDVSLQADALHDELQLQSDDLATLIGSSSVQQFHQLYRTMPANDVSSQSAETFFAEHQYVRYDGSLDDGRLSHWLKQDCKLHKLISEPVLVSTIDHLMPACEGIRGGKQIAPMLRLSEGLFRRLRLSCRVNDNFQTLRKASSSE